MLWIPGPTEVRAALLSECARPMIGHRGPAMTALLERIDPGLVHAFGLAAGSTSSIGVHTCSATGMMEGALLGSGPRILCAVNGAFSRRWFEIARLLGKDVRALEVPVGSAPEPEQVARELERHGPFDAFAFVSNETSTGVCTPLAPMAAALARFPETCVLVDLVSLLAGAPVDFDAHGFDFAFAGSQKALALPPGLTVLAASARYLERARRCGPRGAYLDPVAILEGHAQRKTPATPAISLHYALAQQLEDIGAGLLLPHRAAGLDARAAWHERYAVHARMQARTVQWAASHGLALLPAPALASPTVSCIRTQGIDFPRLQRGLLARGHEISPGYGELKDSTMRIGHMGDHTEVELEELLGLADEVLRAG
jgi:aspartate aminotransferase-like enzyme